MRYSIFINLWTLIRAATAPQPAALSQESPARQSDVTRERDRQPLRFYPF
jgi:hypothetical protein